nr:hypothetical protein Iba_chr13cCG16310 [Ipomoea batatas]
MTPERSAETMVRARPHGYVKEFRDFRHKTQFDKPYTNRPFRFLHTATSSPSLRQSASKPSTLSQALTALRTPVAAVRPSR